MKTKYTSALVTAALAAMPRVTIQNATAVAIRYAALLLALWAAPALAGEIFVTNSNTGTIGKYTTSGATVNAALVSGLSSPGGIAVFGGNLFVANFNTGTIGEYTTSGATVNANFVTGLNGPAGIAVSGGHLFVVNNGNNTIGEYDAATGASINAALISGLPGLHSVISIAVSGSDLFVTNTSDPGTIGKYTTAGATVNAALVSGVGNAFGIAVSGSNLFVTGGNGTIGEYNAVTGATINASLVTGFSDGFGIAVFGSNLFVTDRINGAIGEYATSGATVNAALVSGLHNPAGIAVVPEPSTWALLGIGAISLAMAAVRRRMRSSSISISVALAVLLTAITTGDASAITIPTVPVGNVGNGNDPLTGSLYGGVAYAYSIGTTEVTNAQYAAFLNEKAKSDPLALYNANMGSDARGGITQSGVSPNFSYAPRTDMGNKPVNFVSWYDAIRFANWLNNGQGTGSTETGAYTILGGTAMPSNGLSINRNPGATWFLTSENEWYKAAYYQPAAQGGDVDNYWLYPTHSNGVPTLANANSVGDISNPGTSVANYNNGVVWNGEAGNVTTVGSAGPLSDSFYGTADQGGNVWERNEALIGGSFRGLRGGSGVSLPDKLQSFVRDIPTSTPEFEGLTIGFRVASVPVPEPSTAVLAGVGCALMLWWRKWFR